ncbi:MAG: MATE family efflux transporter [Spirochaetaceae bacterium]|nr:MAG: MATE family efflux transporter [Spirochaetaceae bacterium]
MPVSYRLTEDPIPGLLTRLAAPASIGFFFNTMFNVIDTYWGGRISTDALAALSLSFPVFIVILAAGAGIGSGTNALIANAIGGGRRERAVHYQAQAVSLALIVVVLVGVPLYIGLPSIFRFLNAEGELLQSALRYARVIVAGSPILVLNHVVNSGLTARGDTRSFRNFLILGFVLNIGLDPVLMFGVSLRGVTLIPAMAEAGIALATVVIQCVGLVYLVRRSMTERTFAGCGVRGFIPTREYFREIGGQGFPSAMNMMTMALGTFVITFFISRYGRDPVAAYGAAIRIEQIALIPTIGLNIALATIVGQNNGAGLIDRVVQGYRTSLLLGLVIMVAVLTPVLLFARPLLGIFTDNPEVIRIGLSYLYIEAVTFYSYVVINQANSVMQGVKRPGMILWIAIYRQIAAPFVVFPLLTETVGLGVNGVWWGLAVVNWTAALFALLHARSCIRRARAWASVSGTQLSPRSVSPEQSRPE